MEIKGKVVKKPFGVGSKSERDAVMLEADEGQYVLRRQGGNPFRDPEIDKLVGKTIQATGNLAGYTFLMSDWTEID